MKAILDEREKQPFVDFNDLQNRVGLKEPMKQIADRIMDEITGEVKVTLFVKK
jgi:putative nucleotide binding protein